MFIDIGEVEKNICERDGSIMYTTLHQVTYRREMKCTYYSIKIRSQTLCVVGVLRIRVLEPFFRFFFIFKGGLF